MTSAVVALHALAVFGPLLAAGALVARLGGRRGDTFTAVFWGLALASVAAIVLGRTGRFSLALLAALLTAIALGAWVLGRLLPRASSAPAPPATPTAHRRVAALAAVVAVAWSWPPFATFMAASDSTMYVDAGVHLARTGSYDVADSVARTLPPELARSLFMSVGLLDSGPFVRLAGGLLMRTRDATTATPAFFPLVSAWSGIFTAIGGPTAAPAVAPFGIALATWALTSFAIEALGLAAAIPTALFFLGNFAVWWFGRFTMSEPLTIAFVWSGLVFLARERPFSAGVMLGLAGVARAETILFTIAALAWWAVATTVRPRQLATLVAGAALAGTLSPIGLVASPNHHLAYLKTDLAMAWTQIAVRIGPGLYDGRILCALTLLPLLPAWVGLASAARGWPVWRATLGFLLAIGTVALAAVYARFGGGADPVRYLGWIATSVSWIGLGLALTGGVVLWRRGGSAGRLAVALVVLVSLVFVLNPRVGGYQPWAMRRYLPIVLPGLALFAGTAIGALWHAPRRGMALVAAVLCAATVALQTRSVFAIRHATYFDGTLPAVRRIADAVPADAVVVIDGGLAELQIQVPLWLVFGRETILATGGGPAWRALLTSLTRGGRSVYWLQNRYAEPPRAPDVAFGPIGGTSDMTIDLPPSPPDTPPNMVIRKVVPLQLYGVTARS